MNLRKGSDEPVFRKCRPHQVLEHPRPDFAVVAREELTQAEVARRIHVAQSHISALERGEREPGAAVLLAISQEFGKSVDWLLTGK